MTDISKTLIAGWKAAHTKKITATTDVTASQNGHNKVTSEPSAPAVKKGQEAPALINISDRSFLNALLSGSGLGDVTPSKEASRITDLDVIVEQAITFIFAG